MKKDDIVFKVKSILKEAKVRLIESEDKYDLTDEEMNQVREYAKKMVDENMLNLRKNKEEAEQYLSHLSKIDPSKLDDEHSRKYVEKYVSEEKKKTQNKLDNYNKYLSEFEYDEAIKHEINIQMNSAYGLGFQIRQEKYRKEQLNRALTKGDIIDLFVTSLEGGSNYWYYLKNIPESIKYDVKHNGVSLSDALGEYVLSGGEVHFYDIEDKSEFLGSVDMNSILDAISLIKKEHPEVWERILTEEYDADDADVFLQLCVMGEVVFG